MEDHDKQEWSSRRKWLVWSLMAGVVLFVSLLRVPAMRSVDALILTETIEPISRAYLLNNDKVVWGGKVRFHEARKVFARLPYGEGLRMEVELANGTRLRSRGDYFVGNNSNTYIYVIEKDGIKEYSYRGSYLFDVDPESEWGRTAQSANTIIFLMAEAAQMIAGLVVFAITRVF